MPHDPSPELIEIVAMQLAEAVNGGEFYEDYLYTDHQRDCWRAFARATIIRIWEEGL